MVLVLLSLAVVLTLVLFVVARSITDVAVSSKSQEAVRAFSAAEAGVEQSLVTGQNFTNDSFANGTAKFASVVNQAAEGDTEFTYPVELASGDSAIFWFVSHDQDGNLTCADNKCFTGNQIQLCWGKNGTGSSTTTTPAIEVSVFYESSAGNLGTLKIGRATSDPNSGRITSNNFGDSSGSCSGFAFTKTIPLSGIVVGGTPLGTQNVLQFARVRMLYNSDQTHPLKLIVSGGTLPSQGQNISSTGSAGSSNREVNVFQGWPEPPSVFDYTVYSSSGLTK